MAWKDRRFKHHAWFLDGVTNGFAFDWFCNYPDAFVLVRNSNCQLNMLGLPIEYVLTDRRYTKKLTQYEYEYWIAHGGTVVTEP